MSYQVLARKWRPKKFSEVIGQQHVLQALINALTNQRLHHAYLFSGTRGVGKTTLARIFAKSLNCEQGVSAEPCGICGPCIEIDEGRYVDLIEVDAASKTKVEDTRELLENVQYAPSRGQYKVYLIDEVHMLSNHSFNALLKTLEEPPEHVKFLLATTDPQKLPVTVLSRCLQFNLMNMSAENIVNYLAEILKSEQVGYESSALWQIGRAAEGSMRDALSLTDQAIAYSNGEVSDAQVSKMLGSMDRAQVNKLLECLCSRNAKQLLTYIEEWAMFSPDFHQLLAELLNLLHRVAIAQIVPSAIDNSFGDQEQVLAMAANNTADDIQLFYQLGLIARKDLHLAPDAKSGFEMAMLRMMVFSPEPVSGDLPPLPYQDESVGTVDNASNNVGAAPTTITPAVEALHETTPQVDSEIDTVADLTEPAQTALVDPAMDVDSETVSVPELLGNVERVENSAVIEASIEPATESIDASYNETLNDTNFEATDMDSVVEAISETLTLDAVSTEVQDNLSNLKEEPELSDLDSKSATNLEQRHDPHPQLTGPVNEQSLPAELGAKLDSKKPFEPIYEGNWAEQFWNLSLDSMSESIFGNSSLKLVDGSQAIITVDAGYETIFDQGHQANLLEKIKQQGQQLLDIKVVFGDPVGETPFMYRLRVKEEQRLNAIAVLKSDPFIQQLEQEFGGRLDEASVKPQLH